MRIALIVVVSLLLGSLAAAQNPVPFLNQPLVPASTAPGSPAFTMTVNGAGFVSGSTVKWNGSPRATTFVSNTQVKAAILPSDVATAATAIITVSSPSPGGGTSNFVFFPVMNPSAAVSLNKTSIATQNSPQFILSADFNNDGNLDLAFVVGGTVVSILLGNGDGTFQPHTDYSLPSGLSPYGLVSTDFDGDGNADLALVLSDSGSGALGVLLGNGDGTFQGAVTYPTAMLSTFIVTGDFNRDGTCDVIVGRLGVMYFFPGNGDGTFQSPLQEQISGSFYEAAVTDSNHDGKLDLLLLGQTNIAVALGNGDGTFQSPSTYSIGGQSYSVSAADFNGDGILDLAVGTTQDTRSGSVAMLLGTGTGFKQNVNYPTTGYLETAAADFNGDGKLDLVVTGGSSQYTSLSMLMGKGDGSFQPHHDYAAGFSDSIAIGDFNRDGRIDVVSADPNYAISLLLQDDGTTVGISPLKLVFPTQLVGTVSHYKLVTVKNNGSNVLTIGDVAIEGDFAEINNCDKPLTVGASCHIAVFYTPTKVDSERGILAITDDGGGSPQTIPLTGVGTIVSLVPGSLNFGNRPVGSYSIKNVILTNEGNGPLNISGIAVSGTDQQDFYEIDACGNTLAAGAKCTIQVIFHPSATGSRNATLQVTDNGGGSPQTVPLTGNGT